MDSFEDNFYWCENLALNHNTRAAGRSFTFVREPLDRFVSGYAEIDRHLEFVWENWRWDLFFPIVGSLRKDCPGGFWWSVAFRVWKKSKTKSHPGFVQFCLMTASTWRFMGGLVFGSLVPNPKTKRQRRRVSPVVPRESGWLAGKQHGTEVFTSDLAMISFIRLEAKRVNGMINIIHLSEGIKPCYCRWFETSFIF